MPNRIASVSACLWLLACGGPAPSLDGGRLDAGPDAGSAAICERETDCEDGLFCTEHRCRPGAADADPRGCVLEPGTECESGEVCDETLRRCVAMDCSNPNRDDDGHDAMACGGDDCDDDDPNRYAGNAEVCDSEGHDEDCLSNTFAGATDGDLDGDDEISSACCNGDACGADCNDTDSSVNSGATELCNGVDDDCSGTVDDETAGAMLCPGGVCTAGRCSFAAWDRIFGGSGNDSASAIATDSAGNVYVTGTFGPGVDFGAGPVTNAVLASYTADGALRWVLINESTVTAVTFGYGLAFDPSADRIYLLAAGSARFGGVSIDGGPFLASIDTSGTVSWAVSIPGLAGGLQRRASVQARDGTVVIASSFTSPFDPGDGTVRTAAGTPDGYVAAYDVSGSVMWMRTYGAAGARTELRAVTMDRAGNVYATGEYTGNVDFGSGPTSATSTAIPVISLDAAGALRWARVFDSTGPDRADTIGSGADRLFIAGFIDSGIDFGGGVTSSAGGYVAALDLDGEYRWERVFRGVPSSTDGAATPFDVAAFDDGRVWVVGELLGTVDFGGGGLSSAVDPTGGPPTTDIFMALYSPDRVHLRDRAVGGVATQRADAVRIGPGGSTTIAGRFGGRIDLGSGPRTAPPGTWGFVARTAD